MKVLQGVVRMVCRDGEGAAGGGEDPAGGWGGKGTGNPCAGPQHRWSSQRTATSSLQSVHSMAPAPLHSLQGIGQDVLFFTHRKLHQMRLLPSGLSTPAPHNYSPALPTRLSGWVLAQQTSAEGSTQLPSGRQRARQASKTVRDTGGTHHLLQNLLSPAISLCPALL